MLKSIRLKTPFKAHNRFNYKEATDETLILHYCQSHQLAFDALYERHKASLFTFLKHRANNVELAEEVFQDVWLSVCSKMADFASRIEAARAGGTAFKFKSYLYTMAVNRLTDHFRSGAAKFAALTTDDYSSSIDPSTEPEQLVSAQQLAEKLLTAINELPAEQQEAYLLRRSGFGLAEIADIQGVKHESVRSRLRYATKKLEPILDQLRLPA